MKNLTAKGIQRHTPLIPSAPLRIELAWVRTDLPRLVRQPTLTTILLLPHHPRQSLRSIAKKGSGPRSDPTTDPSENSRAPALANEGGRDIGPYYVASCDYLQAPTKGTNEAIQPPSETQERESGNRPRSPRKDPTNPVKEDRNDSMDRDNNKYDDDDDVVIVAAVRTPLTKSRRGGLASKGATSYDLMKIVFRELLQRSGSTQLRNVPSLIDDVCVGNVLMPSNGFASIRMAQLAAGIPESASLSLVNRQCASSLQALANIANAIRSNSIKIGIAGGVENMTQSPMDRIKPPDIGEHNYTGLPNAALDCLLPMGVTSDTVAAQFGLLRHELDDMAAESHRRAHQAHQSGAFKAEIVECCGVAQDDGIRPNTTAELLAKLRPAFTPQGITTAGNSSQTTDGAAGLLLMKRRTAMELKCPILATYLGCACVGVPPAIMGIGPLEAIPRVLSQLDLSIDDIELFELNEAFASQALYCVRQLQLDAAKVNVNGGAVALGHPLGATGARLVVSIIHELQRRHRRGPYQEAPSQQAGGTGLGVVSMCIGTGMGAAAVLRVEPSSRL